MAVDQIGRMDSSNRDYPLGAVSKMVANISKSEMDEILELGGKAVNCYQTIYLLGYNRNVFLTHKSVILDMLSHMKKLELFQCFDYYESKKLVDDLLSEESLDQYEDYLKSDKPLTEERVLELKDIKKRYDYAIKLAKEKPRQNASRSPRFISSVWLSLIFWSMTFCCS
ncbi:hypothetical protein, partial [uncultured Ruminococcus sp.]|uniref:hypothetical protein n=1 Tax=uncultured Ruminococcus sp. TaxID=165186 RepID=UPI0029318EEA